MLIREQKDILAYLHAYEWEGDKEKLSKVLNAINSPESAVIARSFEEFLEKINEKH